MHGFDMGSGFSIGTQPFGGRVDWWELIKQEPEVAAFDFISSTAFIKGGSSPFEGNIGDVLTNPGASPTKLLRRKSGLLESAPWWANEYDLAGNPMGMRVEAQRPNLLPQSSNLLGSDWAAASVGVVPQAGIAPNGLNEAFKVIPSTTLSSPARLSSNAFFVGGADTAIYACSVYAKAAEFPICRIHSTAATAANTVWDFDLRTGVFIAKFSQSTPAADVGVSIVPVGDGWYRVSVFMTGNIARTHRFGFLGVPEGLLSQASQGDGVGGVLFWQPQAEQAPFPSSSILTTTAAVTRAADQPQISTGFLPYNPAAGTLIMNGMAYDYDNGASSPLLQFAGPGGTDALGMWKDDTGAANARFTGRAQSTGNALASAQMAPNLSVPVAPTPKKLALILGDGKLKVVSGDGTVEETSLAWTPFTFSRLLGGFGPGIAWHRAWVYVPRAMSVSEVLPRIRP